jgi:hypothetical protein
MNLRTELRYRLEYAGFRLIQAGISTRPLEAASRETGIAWRLIAPRLHRQQRAEIPAWISRNPAYSRR